MPHGSFVRFTDEVVEASPEMSPASSPRRPLRRQVSIKTPLKSEQRALVRVESSVVMFRRPTIRELIQSARTTGSVRRRRPRVPFRTVCVAVIMLVRLSLSIRNLQETGGGGDGGGHSSVRSSSVSSIPRRAKADRNVRKPPKRRLDLEMPIISPEDADVPEGWEQPGVHELEGLPEVICQSILRAPSEAFGLIFAMYRHRLQCIRERAEHHNRFSLLPVEVPAILKDALRRSSIFSGWPASALPLLVSCGRLEGIPPKRFLMYKGEPPCEVIIVLRGTVSWIAPNPSRDVKSAGRMHRSATWRGLVPFSKSCMIVSDISAAAGGPVWFNDGLFLVHSPLLPTVHALATHTHCDILRLNVGKLEAALGRLLQRDADALLGRAHAIRVEGLRQRGMTPPEVQRAVLFSHLTDADALAVASLAVPMCFYKGCVVREPSSSSDSASQQSVAHRLSISTRRRRTLSPAQSTDRRSVSTTPSSAGPSRRGALEEDSIDDAVSTGALFVARGELRGIAKYRGANGVWEDLVFARWTAGSWVGERTMYFGDGTVFAIRAHTDVDVFVVQRAVLLQRLSWDSQLMQRLVKGAMELRVADPQMRLPFSTLMAVGWLKESNAKRIITPEVTRSILRSFRFRIVAQGELIFSASRTTVAEMIVVMSGTAIANFATGEPQLLPSRTVIGGYAVTPMRWVCPCVAFTSCEIWALEVATLRTLLASVCSHDDIAWIQTLALQQHREDCRTFGLLRSGAGLPLPNILASAPPDTKADGALIPGVAPRQQRPLRSNHGILLSAFGGALYDVIDDLTTAVSDGDDLGSNSREVSFGTVREASFGTVREASSGGEFTISSYPTSPTRRQPNVQPPAQPIPWPGPSWDDDKAWKDTEEEGDESSTTPSLLEKFLDRVGRTRHDHPAVAAPHGSSTLVPTGHRRIVARPNVDIAEKPGDSRRSSVRTPVRHDDAEPKAAVAHVNCCTPHHVAARRPSSALAALGSLRGARLSRIPQAGGIAPPPGFAF